MKRIFIILPFLLLIAIAGNVQKDMFSKMPPKQRDSTLIEIGKKALLKYAPDYYREYKIPEVIFRGAIPNKSPIKKNIGNFFYQVTFFYDPQKEKMPEDYAAQVFIWGDKGKAYKIWFGNERGLDIEKIENDKNPTIMPFMVPQPFKGTPLPRDTTKVIKKSTAKTYEFPK